MFPLAAFGIRRHAHSARSLWSISVILLLFSLHWALVGYVNATYLYQFVSSSVVGALYTVASLATIVAFLYIARTLRRFGNYALAAWLAIAEICILVGLALTSSIYVAVPLFVLHHALVPLLVFTIDVFIEQLIGTDEQITGGKRGMLLVTVNIGTALAVLGSGLLLGGGRPRFALVYLVSAACMLAFWRYLKKKFKTFKDPVYNEINALETLRYFLITHDLRFVFLCHFLLQLFFAWMVIYVPLYLATVIGFGWDQIGFILFVGLLAYVLFEYPIGMIADRYIGEKEMMGAGFIVLAVATMYMAFLNVPAVLPWMFLLFVTRLGASLVEVTTESYFFKHTKDGDAGVISFFRASRPLAYLLGALSGSVALFFVPFNYVFLLFGLLMLPGVAFSLSLKDTR